MSNINVEQLLEPISFDAPCGENLEYETLAMELETATQGKPEQQYGDTIIPAEEPDWREVQRITTELLKRTKDLRFIRQLARAVLRVQGYDAYRDCLHIIHQYIVEYWDSFHPQLDPDDNNDPMLRVNQLSALNDKEEMLDLIELGVIVTAQGIGKFTYRDFLVAEGERPKLSDDAPDKGLIDAAFMGSDIDELKTRAAAVAEAAELANKIESSLTEKVGAADACSLAALRKKLLEVSKCLQGGLAKRGISTEEAPSEEGGGEVAAAGEAEGAAAAPTGASINGSVNSRNDVITALEKICDYYDTHEPSSPIPLLLKGAKRLASMSFLEIVHDVTPEGLEQLKSIAGMANE